MRLLVDASNLHSGGGVAVATSLLYEMSRDTSQTDQIAVLASDEVHANLQKMALESGSFESYHVFNTYGLNALWRKRPLKPRDFELVLKIFGPNYTLKQHVPTLVGFAQPWIAYPKTEAYRKLKRSNRMVSRLKYSVQAAFFRRSSVLVVEADHVREALYRQRRFHGMPIHVIPSAVDSIHWSQSRWQELTVPQSSAQYLLGVIARNYPHKNLGILPEVRQILQRRYGVSVDFLVTLTDREWAAAGEYFRSCLLNAGSLSLAQTPTFYRMVDGVIFPSLLECFSATPIEALAAGKPIFASDRPFIREFLGDYARYFDPNDAGDIARVVVASLPELAMTPSRDTHDILEISSLYASSQIRYEAYMDLCRMVLRGDYGRLN